MVSTGRKITVILTAVLLLFLLGSAQAMSCEDMPCCTDERVTVSDVTRSDNDCRQCNPVSCSCSVQSSIPDYHQSETGLVICFHFEMESTEEATSLVLPVVEPKTSDELKPFGSVAGELPLDDEHISYWAFPNPPPSV